MPRGELSVPEAPPAVGWLAETDWWGTGQGVLLAVLLLIPLALSPQDWAGWCLLYASFAVVLGPREIRVRPVLAWSLCLVLAVHHLAALVDTWLFTLPGGGVDAALFASRAEALVDRDLVFRLGSSFYSYLLAALYKPLGASPLIGREISVLAFAVALVYFVRLLQLLELQRFAPQLSLLFGLLPATIIFTSLTLREPLELALLITAVFYSMRALRGPRRLRSAGLVLVMAIGMGLLHMVLLLYAGLLALLFVLWPTGGGREIRWRLGSLLVLGIAVVGLLSVLKYLPVKSGDNVIGLLARDIPEQVVRYRAGVDAGDPRTAFGVPLDVSGTLAFIGSFARIYVHYLFAPFPWQAEQARDWYAVGESFLRMGLLVFGVVGVWRARGATRNGLLLLMMVYFSLTCVWAIGTTNFGQSIRHHVTSNWLLVLLGGPPLLMQLATGWRWARDREEPA